MCRKALCHWCYRVELDSGDRVKNKKMLPDVAHPRYILWLFRDRGKLLEKYVLRVGKSNQWYFLLDCAQLIVARHLY
ncbi:hypothetical protein [Nostoc sp. ChiQUE01b]|uniref:hypothetical protein n=1 Tax=Nostoc sp. ChiQUE01b TaxID=3075376 RepID=UPI002AD45ECC|nr:hypothetical protein [Nostoc sp. ChiQUE01b]MDZ8260757.1 hypothetical protein [Nostoc sp. ChiQUE01b]